MCTNGVCSDFDHSTLRPELRREALTPEGSLTFHALSLLCVLILSPLGAQLSMTDKLPPPLLALFQPRPPLRYLPPGDRAPDDCQKSTISGVAQFLADAKTFADEVPYNATESWVQRKLREKTEKKEQLEKQIAEGLQNCTLNLLFAFIFVFQEANRAMSYRQSGQRSPSSR